MENKNYTNMFSFEELAILRKKILRNVELTEQEFEKAIKYKVFFEKIKFKKVRKAIWK